MSQIKTKGEFLRLINNGLLGNYLRKWDRLDQLREDEYAGWLTIRSRHPQNPNFISCCHSHVARCGYKAVTQHLAEFRLRGLDLNDFYLQQVPHPTCHRVANIEAMEEIGGIYVHLETNTTEPVRGIRERTAPLRGASGRLMLKNTISEESYDTLCDLWDKYPGSIIEATEFSRVCGAHHKRLVIWEVRHF